MATTSFTQLELHTHLLSMLSANNLVDLMRQYEPIIQELRSIKSIRQTTIEAVGEFYRILKTGDITTLEISKTLPNNQTMSDYFKPRRNILQLLPALTKYVPFDRFLDLISNSNISKEIIKYIKDLKINSELSDVEAIEALVYSDYLNRSLKELINQGAKYVEISFANLKIIKNVYIEKEVRDKITCRFMLCTNRSNIAFINDISTKTKAERKGYTFEKTALELKAGLEWSSEAGLDKTLEDNQHKIIGFDIMGQETPFTNEELEDDPKSEISFKNKLRIIIDVLKENYRKDAENSLRIHGGEVPGCDTNVLNTLRMLNKIAIETNSPIPPPEIRIGHAVHFIDCPEYFDLLRKLSVIVEINATSNIKLGNIISLNDIRYKRYIEEGIRLTISTDGHGLYDTTIKREDTIAYFQLGPSYQYILKYDDEILAQKKR